jgi:hypothetical protein
VLGARGWAGPALALVNGRLLGGWMDVHYIQRRMGFCGLHVVLALP